MKFSRSEVLPIAESTGFKPDMIEKVLHLLNLLNNLNRHPYLKGLAVGINRRRGFRPSGIDKIAHSCA